MPRELMKLNRYRVARRFSARHVRVAQTLSRQVPPAAFEFALALLCRAFDISPSGSSSTSNPRPSGVSCTVIRITLSPAWRN